MASERGRADIRAERDAWHRHRLPAIQANPARLVFVDETSVKTNMTPIRGRSPKGTSLVADAPAGRWNTQTFIAGLRCHEMVAPFVIDGAIDGDIFEIWVRTQLAPMLNKGDVVIWDNLNVHKNAAAHQAIRARGAWVLFLPRYSPALNPIENGIFQAQSMVTKGQSSNLRRALEDNRFHLRSVFTSGVSKLLQGSSVRCIISARLSKRCFGHTEKLS